MASAMITACGSEETQTTSEESTDSESGSESTEGDYQYVFAADAVSAAKRGRDSCIGCSRMEQLCERKSSKF